MCRSAPLDSAVWSEYGAAVLGSVFCVATEGLPTPWGYARSVDRCSGLGTSVGVRRVCSARLLAFRGCFVVASVDATSPSIGSASTFGRTPTDPRCSGSTSELRSDVPRTAPSRRLTSQATAICPRSGATPRCVDTFGVHARSPDLDRRRDGTVIRHLGPLAYARSDCRPVRWAVTVLVRGLQPLVMAPTIWRHQ
jgi:hypothetical protein